VIDYAAYGSNMNRGQMLLRAGGETEAVATGTALLRDWQIEFRRGVLTVVPQPGAMVPLALWCISELARKALDRYEGAPWLYAPRMLPGSSLTPLSGSMPDACLIYEMTVDGANTIDRADAPGATYYETCVQGYADFGLNDWLWALEAARERSLQTHPPIAERLKVLV
jgi:hypothetical protein